MAIQLKSQNVTNMYTPIELVTTNITMAGIGGGGGGVTDHGFLHGLADNDHPQYMQTANSSLLSTIYQRTSDNSLSLGTAATQSFVHTSAATSLFVKSNSTLLYNKASYTFANSTHIHGNVSIATTDGLNIVASSASNGLTLSVPAYGVAGAASDHSHGSIHYDATSNSTETAIRMTSNSSGFTFVQPSFLTTAYGGALQGSGSYTQNTGTIQFANANGVTFGLSDNGVMTASIPAIGGAQTGISGIADSATTFVEGTMHFVNSNGMSFGIATNGSNATLTAAYSVPGVTVFSNSNNIEFGLSGSTVTALGNFNQSVQTQGVHNVSISGNNTLGTMTEVSSGTLFLAGGNNITLSQSGNKISIIGGAGAAASHNVTVAGNATSAGAGYIEISSGTLTLAGGNNITLSQNGNAITLVGAAQGGVQTGLSGIAASNTTYTSGSVYMSAQANITIGTFATSDTQYVRFSVGNYITTGAVSDHTHGSNVSTASTSGVDIKYTSASNGLTMGIPPYLTTAMQSASSSVFARTGFTSASTAGTDVVGTLNTLGLSIGIPKYISTAAQVSHSHGNPTLNLSNLSGATSSASNGLTINISGYPATSFYNASQSSVLDFLDANGITWGSSVSGSSTSVSASFSQSTHAHDFASASHTHGSVSLALSNISGTYSSASNGLTISLTGATGGTGGAGNLSITAGTFSGTRDAISFANSNNISFGMSGSTLTGSIPMGTVVFSDSNSFSFGSSVSGVSTTITGSFHPSFVSFSDGGGVTWGTTAGSATNVTVVTATVNAGSGAAGSWATSTKTGSDIQISTGAATNVLHYGNFLTTYVAQTTQPVAFSGSNTSAAFSTLTFGNSNGLSHYITNGSLVASYTVPGATVFSNDNSITFGLSGSTVTANFSQSTHPHTSLVYSNANGVGFGVSGSTLTASYTQSTHTHDFTQYAGILTTNVTGLSATINSSQIQLNVPQGSLYYQDGNGVSFSASSSGLSTTISGYVNTAAGVASDHTHGNVSMYFTGAGGGAASASNGLSISVNVGEFQAGVGSVGNTGGTTGQGKLELMLVGSDNITLSQSSNASGATVSIYGASGGSQSTPTQFVGLASTGITGGSATINSSQALFNIPVGTVYFSDSNSFSFGSSVGTGASSNLTTITGSFHPASINFADSNGISWGSSTSGSTTTITASYNSTHTHGSPTLNLTGLNGSTSSSSNGMTLNLSVVVPAGNNIFFVNTNGHSFSSSSTGVSTYHWIVT